VNKSIFKKIEMKGSCYFEIIPWNEKYIISANYRNNSIDIFDIEKEELFKQIKTSHSAGVRAVKKIFHSIYGECLITSGHDSIIKMWSI
jgi:WD40 repeat protein